MTVITAEAPAKKAGVSPSQQRYQALRSIGSCVTVRMDDISEGQVVLLRNKAHVVLRKNEIRGNGRRTFLRTMEGASVHSVPFMPESWITRLQLPLEVTDGEGRWTIQQGDIVLYPGDTPEHAVAAIRHHFGWLRTAAPWAPFSDAEVILHVYEGRARVVRNATHQGAQPLRKYPSGSVVACRQIDEPTVWVRLDNDLWVSNTPGVTASDLMINYELDRRTYHVVWVPENDR